MYKAICIKDLEALKCEPEMKTHEIWQNRASNYIYYPDVGICYGFACNKSFS